MSEIEIADTTRLSRPSLAQVKAIVDFIYKHPNLAHRRVRQGATCEKIKNLWVELSNIVNSIKGAVKSTKGWIKFWSDKRRNIVVKQMQINSGKIVGKLTALEQKILNISSSERSRKSKSYLPELCNGNENLADEILGRDENDMNMQVANKMPTEADERHLSTIEKMIEAMDQQAAALGKMAQATIINSKAMEKIAEASHKQALAVDRLAGTFETINTSVYDVRNAVISIDYTMKRCFSANTIQQRQNANLFS